MCVNVTNQEKQELQKKQELQEIQNLLFFLDIPYWEEFNEGGVDF